MTMHTVLVLLLFLVPWHSAKLFRVLSFNTWEMGANVEDGLAKIARQVQLVDADVVALQEVSSAYLFGKLLSVLGPTWTGKVHSKTYPGAAFLTKHKIVSGSMVQTRAAVGVHVLLPTGKEVAFWSLDFDFKSYGPYAAISKAVTKLEQIYAGEDPKMFRRIGRVRDAMEIAKHKHVMADVANATLPLVLAGTIRSPSGLDWIEANKHMHGGWVVDWPAPKMLMSQLGAKDAYREIHPDPVADPGITYSTVKKTLSDWDFAIPEPQDRIDMVFYKGAIRPVEAQTYAGNDSLSIIPKHMDNLWPSDHYAVIVDFELAKETTTTTTITTTTTTTTTSTTTTTTSTTGARSTTSAITNATNGYTSSLSSPVSGTTDIQSLINTKVVVTTNVSSISSTVSSGNITEELQYESRNLTANDNATMLPSTFAYDTGGPPVVAEDLTGRITAPEGSGNNITEAATNITTDLIDMVVTTTLHLYKEPPSTSTSITISSTTATTLNATATTNVTIISETTTPSSPASTTTTGITSTTNAKVTEPISASTVDSTISTGNASQHDASIVPVPVTVPPITVSPGDTGLVISTEKPEQNALGGEAYAVPY